MPRGQPDAVTFNEYAGQYLYAPLRVRAGQRIRIRVLDAGPAGDSAFHVVGAQFGTVFSNGAYLLQPGNPADGAARTLDLMPGEGGFAGFTVPAAGQYEMLDHHLDHAAAGGGRVHRGRRALTALCRHRWPCSGCSFPHTFPIPSFTQV